MNKERGYRLLFFLAIIAILAAGCSPKNIEPDETDASVEPAGNPFEANEPNSQIMNSIGHGLADPPLDEQGRRLPLQYHGGELKIDYKVHASGNAKNVGFLVFVDGKPQPYKFNTSDAPYEYMHVFDLQGEDQDTLFTFVFTPVTGKKGDTLPVSIASVYNPEFMPDMKETASYGGFHTTLGMEGLLHFNEDADALDASSIPRQEALRDVRLSSEPVTQDLLEKRSGFGTVDLESLDTNVYSELQLDGAERQDHYQVGKKGALHVTFKLFGHPGVRYRNTFYINHQAISAKDGTFFETMLTKGDVAVFNAEIELEKLEDFNTFYVVSVPVNADDFPDDVVVLEKTASILLYR